MSPVAPRFDDLVHAPTRLSVVSLLAATEHADFRFVRDSVGLSDSALSKQLSTLEDAGYVALRKTFEGKRARTFVTLTPDGRRALAGHLAALREIVARSGMDLAADD
ncbi:winged helix-turn-helix domain-containing protein [Sanguibacter suaedae]|uniref:Transcriptional regulator n=1 Tax=Sanguibacter suaedae TaxID=2795737 RepID=A0A934M8J2_9MICO|nr:transcriptional regulator [Sanguibacter suaedae]MBI9113620.1 transcriptional regulator [Sanguibacter suaedae]